MTYRVILTDVAAKQLKKLDRYNEKIILGWIQKYIDGSENPRAHGKSLTGDLSGYWRYRVGDYRLICKIYDDVCEVIVVEVGHRSRIYG